MTTLQVNTSITRGEAEPYGATQGTPAEALTSRGVDDRALWKEALEGMLSWRSNPEQFEPEDRPDTRILDTAIDYTMDQLEMGTPVPSSIVPSGGGQVAFEWRARDETMIVEFVDRGEAVLTHFVGDRVSEKAKLIRDPLTRRLELES